MIKSILTDALNKVKGEETSAIAEAIANNKSSVVSPKFQEIESAKLKAIAEVQSDANAKIANLTKNANEAKSKFEDEQRQAVTDAVKAKYENEISSLQSQIDGLTE